MMPDLYGTPDGGFFYCGIRVKPSRHVPERASNFKLNQDVPLSDGFRQSMQAWLDDFFGTFPVFYVIDPRACGLSGEKLIVSHPSNVAALCAGVREWRPSRGRE